MQSQDQRNLSEGSELRGIYCVGGTCAAITGITFFSALVSIVAYGTNPPTLMSQELPYISSHATLWELAYGSLLMAVIFSLPAIVALYYVLRGSSKTFTTVGSFISVAAAPAFMVGIVNMLSVVSLGGADHGSKLVGRGASKTNICMITNLY